MSDGLSMGRVKPTMGPAPPKVVAEVPVPLVDPGPPEVELFGEPKPELDELELNIEEMPFDDPALDDPPLGDPKPPLDEPKPEVGEPPLCAVPPKPLPEVPPNPLAEEELGAAMGTPLASVVVAVVLAAYIEELTPPMPAAIISGCPKKPRGRTCA